MAKGAGVAVAALVVGWPGCGVAAMPLVVGWPGCGVVVMPLVVLAALQPASTRAHTSPITARTCVNGCLANMA